MEKIFSQSSLLDGFGFVWDIAKRKTLNPTIYNAEKQPGVKIYSTIISSLNYGADCLICIFSAFGVDVT